MDLRKRIPPSGNPTTLSRSILLAACWLWLKGQRQAAEDEGEPEEEPGRSRRKAGGRRGWGRGRADTTHQVYNSFKLKLSHTCTHTRSVAPHKHTHTYIWEYRATSNEQLERKNNIFVAFPRCVLGNQRSGETAAQPWGEVRLLVLKEGGHTEGRGRYAIGGAPCICSC